MNQYFIVFSGFLGFCLLLGFLEIVTRKKSLSSEWVRRVSHILAAVFTVLFSMYLNPPLLITALLIFSILMYVSRKKKLLKHIHEVSRPTIGEELLPLGFILAIIISGNNAQVFVPAIFIAGFADPLTGIIMQRWNNHMWGILMFTVIGACILILTTPISFPLVLAIAVLAAFTERIAAYGIDNLTVPAVTALLLTQVM